MSRRLAPSRTNISKMARTRPAPGSPSVPATGSGACARSLSGGAGTTAGWSAAGCAGSDGSRPEQRGRGGAHMRSMSAPTPYRDPPVRRPDTVRQPRRSGHPPDRPAVDPLGCSGFPAGGGRRATMRAVPPRSTANRQGHRRGRAGGAHRLAKPFRGVVPARWERSFLDAGPIAAVRTSCPAAIMRRGGHAAARPAARPTRRPPGRPAVARPRRRCAQGHARLALPIGHTLAAWFDLGRQSGCTALAWRRTSLTLAAGAFGPHSSPRARAAARPLATQTGLRPPWRSDS